MNYAIIINTLEYVFKGGRISKVQYIAANLLHLNLVCSSDGTGKIIVADKFRERKEYSALDGQTYRQVKNNQQNGRIKCDKQQ